MSEHEKTHVKGPLTVAKLNAWITDMVLWLGMQDADRISLSDQLKVNSMIATCRRLVALISEGKHMAVPDRSTLHILIADDDPTIRTLVSKMMIAEGFEITTAANGHEAVAAVQLTDSFDVILMDISMPILDGVTAANHIRSIPGKRGSVPIVAMTGYSARGDRERFLNAGFDDYEAKPVNRERLVAKIDRLTGRSAAQLRELEAYLEAQARTIGAAGIHTC